MADIPGLIEGAAEGTGLGIQFLKHLSRTHLLLHLLDMGPDRDPVADATTIITELERYDVELAGRDRWLVLNKTDLIPEDERGQRCRDVVKALNWNGPVFEISALARTGTDVLVHAVMDFIENRKRLEEPAEDG
jgi:GTP-binding protein